MLPVFAYGTITLYGQDFQPVLLTFRTVVIRPTTPTGNPMGLGYIGFARRYFQYLF